MTEGKGALDGVWRYKWRTRENLPPSSDELNVTLSGAEGALSRTLEAGSARDAAETLAGATSGTPPGC